MADLESQRSWRPLVTLILVSVALRIIAALYLGNEVQPSPGAYDQVSYDRLAQRLVDGQGMSFSVWWWPLTAPDAPTAHWSFLYSFLLAGVYGLVGHAPLVARLLQAVAVGILLPLATFGLARRVFDERVGIWAAGISAVYVYFVYYSATLMTEMLTIVFVLWMLQQVLRIEAGPADRRAWVLFGLSIGLAGLLRQVTLLPVPLLSLWLFKRAPSRKTVQGIALAALVSLVLILPFTYRNWLAFERFVLINTNAGYAFFWANHPIHGSDFMSILPADGPQYDELIPEDLRGLDEAALNDALMARGWAFVREDPGRYLRLSISRIDDYFKFWPSSSSSMLSNVSRVLSFGLFLPFMLLGLFWSRRHAARCMPLYIFMGSYVSLHLLSWALIRYRLPVDAVLILFAALALERLVGRRLPALAPAGAGA